MGYLSLLAADTITARHVISPNFHPVIVHFPLGMFVFGLVLELLGLIGIVSRQGGVRLAGRWMIVFGALMGIPAAMSGIDAYSDVINNSSPKLQEMQLGLLTRHIQFTAIGSAVAAVTVTIALGLSDRWRRLLYFPLLLLLLGGAGLLTSGSHFAGEGIYLQHVAVALKGEPAKGIEFWAPAQSTHLLLAGFAVAVAMGALGTSLRVMSDHSVARKDADADRELAQLGEPPPSDASAGSQPIALDDPHAAPDPVAAHIARERAISRSLTAPIDTPRPRTASGRFWMLACVLFLATLGLGVWLLISVEEDSFLSDHHNQPTVNQIWQEVVGVTTATKNLTDNRRGAHVVLGAGLVVLPLLLALIVRVMPRRRWLVGTLCLLIFLIMAAEIWLGILLVQDSSEGPLWRWKPDQASIVQPLARHLT